MATSVRWTPREVGLVEQQPGLWVTAQHATLSYPASGNEACYQIEERSFWFRHRNACITAIARRLPPAGLFADVGGGNGFVSRALADDGHDVALVEPGQAGARNGWHRGVRPVICATLGQAGFEKGTLGGIGLFDVVEHIEHHVDFLADMRAHLRQDGRVYLTVPAFRTLWSAEDVAAGHYRRYSPSRLRRTLAQAGFAVEYLSAMFAWLPLPVFLARSLPTRLGLRSAESEQGAREHLLPRGVAGRVIARALEMERNAIAAGRSLPVGGSLIAVARPAVSGGG